MAALWSLFQTAALGIAAAFWLYVVVGLTRWILRDPRHLAHVLCGELALAFGLLAVLWAAHLL